MLEGTEQHHRQHVGDRQIRGQDRPAVAVGFAGDLQQIAIRSLTFGSPGVGDLIRPSFGSSSVVSKEHGSPSLAFRLQLALSLLELPQQPAHRAQEQRLSVG